MPNPGALLNKGWMIGSCCVKEESDEANESDEAVLPLEFSELEALRKCNADLVLQCESLQDENGGLLEALAEHQKLSAKQEMQLNATSNTSVLRLSALSTPSLEEINIDESASKDRSNPPRPNPETSKKQGLTLIVDDLSEGSCALGEKHPVSRDISQEKGCPAQDMDTSAADTDDLVAVHHQRVFFKKLRDSRIFNIVSLFALTFALIGASLWTICDIPDDPGNAVLDVVMVLITVFFVFEIMVNATASQVYRLSFFFWMDVLGTVSMLFEISFLLGSADIGTNKLRAARASKLGARAGRLLKLVKCLTLYYRRSAPTHDYPEATGLSKRLMQTVSTKVSMLTVFLFMILPLFSLPLYPEDLSMSLWSQRLEESYYLAYQTNTLSSWQFSVQELGTFYKDVKYHPYKIEGFAETLVVDNNKVLIPGQSLLHHSEPARKENVFTYDVQHCRLIRAECNDSEKPSIYFDFTHWNQVDAGLDIATTVLIIIVMVVASFDINNSITAIWFKPITRMLHIARVRAASIYDNFFESSGESAEKDDDEQTEDAGTELDMLEHILDKLARMADLVAKRNELDKSELTAMDFEGLGVMFELLGSKLVTAPEDAPKLMPVKRNSDSANAEAVQKIKTWNVDVLQMQSGDLLHLIYTILFQTDISPARDLLEQKTFHSFHRLVKLQYFDNRYHCYEHACDVLHTVFLELSLTKSTEWLNDNERYALLVAALCHDLGHFGRTNPFLVETKHPMAILYNDSSPLENMHCAKLFEICSHAQTDVFSQLGKVNQQEVRKVCIASILHTDNAHHFTMVKDLGHAYELASDICEAQAVSSELLPKYMTEVLQKDKSIWLQLFLHLADVSNPLKPFDVCCAWAWRVLDEFFEQGDEEKELGIPVGMLNDRAKVNRPGSQHGFINFLVAPLVYNAVRLFPVLQPLYAQMASNLEAWRDMWIRDVQPAAEDIAKKDADVQKIKETSQQLTTREPDPSSYAGRRATLIRASSAPGRKSMRQSMPALKST